MKELLSRISAGRLRHDLYYLCRDPLPFRKVNYTRPGLSRNSLAEADDYIREQLQLAGYQVNETSHRVQAFRCDSTKPLHHWYSAPQATDPFYDVKNLEVTRNGVTRPDEIIQLISHKDSMSWIDSPGAHDNAVGTVVNMELARLLAKCELRRSVRILFCNEEHTPWTSRFAAQAAAKRGDNIVAALNVDALDGKSDEEMAAGKLSHVVCYSTDEGKALAEMMLDAGSQAEIGLDVRTAFKPHVNDDDGEYIKAGFRAAVANIGSWPYGDSEYHLPGDVPERVNIDNLVRCTQFLLASVLALDAR